ncbi:MULTISPECIES: histidine phosphatase family protein [Dietzia]|jgi:broad specificity phosphatase PhoE|uniref:Histidine phosphatase family protein n=1 Tax=Dietzia maris TaxID=37915 RepID=A0A365P857_9ACTN|nr:MULTISPECIES: histidine phosphatase family protein [Dietzia]ODQ84183.1 phosphoglycerate mutase [Dietzia alimentaria]MBB0998104.1 histidine phosphatase family protein [Dietzia maris]MCZ4540304.1 histidine phosphatase family protein [Dietzia maris]MCZ4655738.1 histidine phosphatase family protein [Dietzia kunjamensis]MDJ0422444.1 histidine phosphatase family protein [Dietzia kunjamensis]
MGSIHLVRHGQASFGSGDYDRLSETGHLQARLAGEDMAGRGLRPDVIIHGGLRRQRETAEGLLAGLRAHDDRDAAEDVAVEVDERWAEYDADAVLEAARVAGLTTEHGTLDSAGASDEAKQAFQRQLDAALGHWAGLEAFAEYRRDADDALADAAARSGTGRTTVVVSSAGTISLAVAGLLADPEGVVGLWTRLQRVTVNTGTARVVVGRGGMTCIAVNEHQHLERAAGPDDPRRLVTLR